jgi:hypothetical protein
MRDEIDALQEAMAAGVVPCLHMAPDQSLGHGWASGTDEHGHPRCESCLEWERRRSATGDNSDEETRQI